MLENVGQVVKSTGSWHTVITNNNILYNCRLRGKFKIQGIKSTNPIAVGDYVKFNIEKTGNGFITNIVDRKNCIIRKSTNLSKQTHIVAANLDQSILIVTLAYPRTSSGFIDRFLLSAEAYDVPSVIVFNKIDLYDDIKKEQLSNYTKIYENAGYKVVHVSAQSNINIDKLKNILKDRTSLISGHSGVGKSTLINCIEPDLNIKTQNISEYHEKGKHTTTFTTMHNLSFGGKIIDTPGIKEFGLVDFAAWELCHWFPEFKKHILNCKFSNCTHNHEPLCAVYQAVLSNEIDQTRYKNYLNILNNVNEEPEDWE